MSTAVSIRMSDYIAYELEGPAMIMARFRMYITSKAIESYLQEYADYSVATERLDYNDDEIISSDEMGTRLALYD